MQLKKCIFVPTITNLVGSWRVFGLWVLVFGKSVSLWSLDIGLWEVTTQ
jgi:hypothetical protein